MHCPYFFHGPDCAPGHRPSKAYGCLGDFKKGWAAACKKAGFPVGRRNGGFTFHHTRNTAATHLAATMDQAQAMKFTGHQTPSIFGRYDCGQVEAQRQQMEANRAYVEKLPSTSTAVTPLRKKESA